MRNTCAGVLLILPRTIRFRPAMQCRAPAKCTLASRAGICYTDINKTLRKGFIYEAFTVIGF